jgi:hypothetical protein
LIFIHLPLWFSLLDQNKGQRETKPHHKNEGKIDFFRRSTKTIM